MSPLIWLKRNSLCLTIDRKLGGESWLRQGLPGKITLNTCVEDREDDAWPSEEEVSTGSLTAQKRAKAWLENLYFSYNSLSNPL